MTALVACRGVEVLRSGRRILGPLDADFAAGRITAICGANGSGKTTLLNTLAGRITPDGGEVLLRGRPVTRLRGKALGRSVAVLRQHQQRVAGLSVRELVAFGRYPYRTLLRRESAEDRAAIDRALSMCLLEPLAGRDMSELSGGEQQRAWLALALAQEPELLLLDEPTSYLDVRFQVELLSLLRQLSRTTELTIIAVLHDLDQVMRVADDVVLLRGGAMVGQGPTARMLTAEKLGHVFDLPVGIAHDAQGQAYVRIDWLGASS